MKISHSERYIFSKNKGFTLIELLVVIAIIGVLSAIVLSSLSNARSKGGDSAVKSNLANLRARAELYYDTNGYYTTGNLTSAAQSITNCGCTSATCGAAGGLNNSIFDATAGASNSLIPGITAAVSANGGTAATCYLGDASGARATKWAVSAALKTRNLVSGSSGQDFWCVDYTGSSKILDAAISTYNC